MSRIKNNVASLAICAAMTAFLACGGGQTAPATCPDQPAVATPSDTPTTPPPADMPAPAEPAAPVFKGPPWLAPGANIASWEREFESPGREVWSRRKEIVKKMKIKPGQTVADFGAGTGVMLDALSAAVGKKGKVYALDLAPPFLAWMRKKVEKYGWNNVEVVEAKPETTTLPDNSVDVVFMADVYHHLSDAKTTLADIKRILKPGGAFYLLDFDRRVPKADEVGAEGSRFWVLDHLKMTRADMVNDVLANGFKEEGSPDPRFLEENFLARFVVAK